MIAFAAAGGHTQLVQQQLDAPSTVNHHLTLPPVSPAPTPDADNAAADNATADNAAADTAAADTAAADNAAADNAAADSGSAGTDDRIPGYVAALCAAARRGHSACVDCCKEAHAAHSLGQVLGKCLGCDRYSSSSGSSSRQSRKLSRAVH